MTPLRVTVQIRGPSPGDLGQVSEGFYVVRDGVLTLTSPDGSPLVRSDGTPVEKTHRLAPGDVPEAIARMLTKKARRELLGITEIEEAFRRPLVYQPLGVA